jgi:trimeric autotransporter adhesin
MPNTTNFNWPTPADTDLVKDGAAAIRNLGDGVDTSLVDLKGGTTGQILSKASDTDMDFAFITPNVGDLTEVQAGTGISVADGTGPIPIVTNTVATEFDAKGDLVVGTGSDTFDRLAVGTDGYTLVADSAEATGLKWAASTAGDITEVQAGVGISVADGTGPIPIITNSSTDLITTAGDLLYGTAADTVARLGIGTVGQVLQVNSGATAPEWATASAGGLTLLSTTTLSGASVTVSSISGSYTNLLILLSNFYTTTQNDNVSLRLNADTASNYAYGRTQVIGSTVSGTSSVTSQFVLISRTINTNTSGSVASVAFNLLRYTDTTANKFGYWSGRATDSTGNTAHYNGTANYKGTSAVDSVTVFADSNWGGGTLYIYGVK